MRAFMPPLSSQDPMLTNSSWGNSASLGSRTAVALHTKNIEYRRGTVAKQPKHHQYEDGGYPVQLKISNTIDFRTENAWALKNARRLIAAFAGRDILVP